jgi:hypothetical protein
MKKYFILTLLLLAVAIILRAKAPSNGWSSTPSACSTMETNHSFHNVQAWGNELLNTKAYTNLAEFLNEDFIIDITIKATGGCTFTWNKKYTKANNYKDVFGNTVNNIMLPSNSPYTITVKVESPLC